MLINKLKNKNVWRKFLYFKNIHQSRRKVDESWLPNAMSQFYSDINLILFLGEQDKDVNICKLWPTLFGIGIEFVDLLNCLLFYDLMRASECNKNLIFLGWCFVLESKMKWGYDKYEIHLLASELCNQLFRFNQVYIKNIYIFMRLEIIYENLHSKLK